MSRVYILSILLFVLWSCKENSTKPDEDLQIDDQVLEQAAVGWEVNNYSSVTNDLESLTFESNSLEAGYTITVPDRIVIKEEISQMRNLLKSKLRLIPEIGMPAKINTDSLIAGGQESRHGLTVRWALYYNTETGIARLYEVKEGFPSWRHMEYDSAEIKADLNLTLDDATDDKILALYRLQDFEDTFFITKIISEVTATDYDGQIVTGFILSENTHYNGLRELVHKLAMVEFNPDGSGSVEETLEFSDNTTSSTSVVFINQYNGSFSRTMRNGISIAGNFNRVEDDLHGFYNETVTFPSGHYLSQVYHGAEVAIQLPDTTLNGLLREIIYFASGHIDSARITVMIHVDEGVKTTTLNILKHNDAYGTIVIVEDELGKTMTGEWTTWNQYYIIFNGQHYPDGSATLHYEVYVSKAAFDNGDDPIVEADYNFYPDCGGSGRIIFEGQEYDVEFDHTGFGFIKRGGKQKRFEVRRMMHE